VSISPPDLAAAMAAGSPPVLLDVRSRPEYARGRVPGAVHVPFWDVGRLRRIPLRPTARIIVYCGHGPRAWIAGIFLRARGFRDVSYLEGHMAAWRRAGLPQERDPA
jgi:rhodanese-related sulfurtransferase